MYRTIVLIAEQGPDLGRVVGDHGFNAQGCELPHIAFVIHRPAGDRDAERACHADRFRGTENAEHIRVNFVVTLVHGPTQQAGHRDRRRTQQRSAYRQLGDGLTDRCKQRWIERGNRQVES